ncbi:MBL fold metallo-hydrolase [Salinirubellus sp. GCM10025818]|uniref:MBL fold metallo-hydrolase n=1 Tax=Salinirubellus TaxID=2162630 RepID=UPI0030CF4CA3
MVTNLAQGKQVFTSNAFLVAPDVPDDADGRTVVVDPGNEFDAVAEIRERVSDVDAVVLTHTHSDHVGNVSAVSEAFDADVWGFDPDHELVDHAIADDDLVEMGGYDYLAVHTPGHKDDHLCFYARDSGVLFAGDLVFANGSFGRTDLAEGDRERLIASIDRLLDLLDGDLREMHTGHGPSVTREPRRHVEAAAEAARSMP